MAELTPEQHEAVRTYQAAGVEYIKDHPDFNELLNKAGDRGLRLGNHALREIIEAGERGVRLTHYLALPENFDAAKRLHDVAEENKGRQVAEVKKLLSLIDRSGHGLAYEPPTSSTDKYLAKRKEDIRAGRRRR